ncbi:MAG: hypothetical protein UHN41_06770 [Bacteroidales bacterium]|nr:hypothetical protein [Bacteroidales bacterium]
MKTPIDNDLEFYIGKKQQLFDKMEEENKSTGALGLEIAYLRGLRTYIATLERENDEYRKTVQKYSRILEATEHLQKYYAIHGITSVSDQITSLILNPERIIANYTIEKNYFQSGYELLQSIEDKFSPYNQQHVEYYSDICKQYGFDFQKCLQVWINKYEKRENE